MTIEFKRSKTQFKCDNCKSDVEKLQPYWYLVIGNYANCLCEDCGNDLQNDLGDEYQKFSDLKK